MTMMIPDSIAQWRLPDGSVVRLEDWVDKPVWSTADLLGGFNDATIGLFTYSVGEEVSSSSNILGRRIATERDTNIDVGGALASTEEILVFALRMEVAEVTLDEPGNDANLIMFGRAGQPMPSMNNLAILNATLVVRLMISQKAYIEEGFGYFNAGFGPFGLTTQAIAAGGRSYGTPGLPSDEAVRYYRMPHHIGGTEKYRVELKNYTGGVINFWDEADPPAPLENSMHTVICHLEGARKRPTA
jgi:hypothetical protein